MLYEHANHVNYIEKQNLITEDVYEWSRYTFGIMNLNTLLARTNKTFFSIRSSLWGSVRCVHRSTRRFPVATESLNLHPPLPLSLTSYLQHVT